MIDKARRDRRPAQPELPLIRLRVVYSGERWQNVDVRTRSVFYKLRSTKELKKSYFLQPFNATRLAAQFQSAGGKNKKYAVANHKDVSEFLKKKRRIYKILQVFLIKRQKEAKPKIDVALDRESMRDVIRKCKLERKTISDSLNEYFRRPNIKEVLSMRHHSFENSKNIFFVRTNAWPFLKNSSSTEVSMTLSSVKITTHLTRRSDS